MATRFGPQPVREALRKERWSIAQAAREIDVAVPHLVRVALGIVSPKPEVRERLPKFLNKPIEELFTAEVLAHPYWGKGGSK